MTSLLTTMRQRLADAESDAERLRAAIKILEQAEESSPTPAPRTRTRPARKPAVAVVPLEKLLKVVSENPGMTTTGIAKTTGGDQSVLLELLKESERNGEVRRQGERRATSWYRITDEDRIAARAAEIAAQSKTAGSRGSTKPPKRKVASAG